MITLAPPVRDGSGEIHADDAVAVDAETLERRPPSLPPAVLVGTVQTAPRAASADAVANRDMIAATPTALQISVAESQVRRALRLERAFDLELTRVQLRETLRRQADADMALAILADVAFNAHAEAREIASVATHGPVVRDLKRRLYQLERTQRRAALLMLADAERRERADMDADCEEGVLALRRLEQYYLVFAAVAQMRRGGPAPFGLIDVDLLHDLAAEMSDEDMALAAGDGAGTLAAPATGASRLLIYKKRRQRKKMLLLQQQQQRAAARAAGTPQPQVTAPRAPTVSAAAEAVREVHAELRRLQGGRTHYDFKPPTLKYLREKAPSAAVRQARGNRPPSAPSSRFDLRAPVARLVPAYFPTLAALQEERRRVAALARADADAAAASAAGRRGECSPHRAPPLHASSGQAAAAAECTSPVRGADGELRSSAPPLLLESVVYPPGAPTKTKKAVPHGTVATALRAAVGHARDGGLHVLERPLHVKHSGPVTAELARTLYGVAALVDECHRAARWLSVEGDDDDSGFDSLVVHAMTARPTRSGPGAIQAHIRHATVLTSATHLVQRFARARIARRVRAWAAVPVLQQWIRRLWRRWAARRRMCRAAAMCKHLRRRLLYRYFLNLRRTTRAIRYRRTVTTPWIRERVVERVLMPRVMDRIQALIMQQWIAGRRSAVTTLTSRNRRRAVAAAFVRWMHVVARTTADPRTGRVLPAPRVDAARGNETAAYLYLTNNVHRPVRMRVYAVWLRWLHGRMLDRASGVVVPPPSACVPVGTALVPDVTDPREPEPDEPASANPSPSVSSGAEAGTGGAGDVADVVNEGDGSPEMSGDNEANSTLEL